MKKILLSFLRSGAKRANCLVILLLSFSVIASGNPLLDEALLTQFEADYDIYASGVKIATRSLSLTRDDEGFYQTASLTIPSTVTRVISSGQIKQTSTFLVLRDIFSSRRYESIDSLNPSATRTMLYWDWDALVLWGDKEETIVMRDLDRYTDRTLIDPLTFEILMMHDAHKNIRRRVYSVFSGHGAEAITVERLGTEQLTTPTKEKIKTIKLSLTNDRHPDNSSLVWLSERMHYLPIQTERHEGQRLVSRSVLQSYAFEQLR